MNEQDARAAVVAALVEVAPDIDETDLSPTARLRQDLEIDSLDFLGVLELLAEKTGVDTPEEDYSGLTTVRALIDYVAARA